MLGFGAEPYLVSAVSAVLASRTRAGQQLDLEVVVVDNGTDSEVIAAVAGLPRVRVLDPGINTGFTGGCNLGVAQSRGTMVALVNSDAVVSAHALAALTEVASESGVGIATGSIRLADEPDTMNSAGNPLHLTGLVWAGAHGQPASQYGQRRRVACASGAALVLRRHLWEELGGLTPEYFAYHEDTEVSLRCWQRGLQVVYVPDALVSHHYEFSRNPTKLYLLERNRLILVATTYSGLLLFLLAPLLIGFEIAVAIAALTGGWWAQKWAGWRWMLSHLGWIRSRRRQLQSERTVADRDLAGLFTARVDPSNVAVPAIMAALNPLVAGYWSLVRRLL
ncbi:MAG: glycosyltransferase family 2 protein [Geodermatophilaceae bacterium]|nr:glycosyltransferase family 2 protein [Geodermatophilaceae bacterium]